MDSARKEFEDPEQSYRRGYAHGVWDVLEAVRDRLSPEAGAMLEEWYREEVWEWRLRNKHGQSDRQKWPDPFPEGVRPPRNKLRLELR